MNTGSYFIGSKEAYGSSIRVPKIIARVTLCGAMSFDVLDNMSWNQPTPEQIKNLKETFNIDVHLFGEGNDEEE